MPDMDGIELARHLLKLRQSAGGDFHDGFHEHAVQAFEVHAIDTRCSRCGCSACSSVAAEGAAT
jgi:DNA-binding LytR/AlgR family response regulator